MVVQRKSPGDARTSLGVLPRRPAVSSTSLNARRWTLNRSVASSRKNSSSADLWTNRWICSTSTSNNSAS